jgi:hypothetical protein
MPQVNLSVFAVAASLRAHAIRVAETAAGPCADAALK